MQISYFLLLFALALVLSFSTIQASWIVFTVTDDDRTGVDLRSSSPTQEDNSIYGIVDDDDDDDDTYNIDDDDNDDDYESDDDDNEYYDFLTDSTDDDDDEPFISDKDPQKEEEVHRAPRFLRST
eukprot:scaffold5259_cov168-Ochromonas_danica.AAC.9